MTRVSPQLLVFSYHKTGTSLLLHVMTKVSALLGLTLENHFGLVDQLDSEPDIVLLPHSLLRASLDWPYRAIRMIRDPRDIWVSGYLYHRHCDEEWCTNTDLDPTPPIGWPRVDHAFAHRPEEWKQHYLERLNGLSYQRNLLDRDVVEGLDFEREGYTGCTLEAMRDWDACGVTALDVKLEDAMDDFDGTLSRVFDHFGFTAEQIEVALAVARSEDVSRMDDATIATRPQIHSRTISKWRDTLTDAQIAGFEARYGDLIQALGYDLSTSSSPFAKAVNDDAWFEQPAPSLAAEFDLQLVWPGVAHSSNGLGEAPDPAVTTGDADVRLSADGVAIRPTTTGPGGHGFVVPAGVTQVRLESRRVIVVDPGAPYLGAGRSLGVRVGEITIRSRAGEVVIPADDPRLVHGWHGVEQIGSGLWRWTDGAGELPWNGAEGPAVVMVRCTALDEYPVDDPMPRVEGLAV